MILLNTDDTSGMKIDYNSTAFPPTKYPSFQYSSSHFDSRKERRDKKYHRGRYKKSMNKHDFKLQ